MPKLLKKANQRVSVKSDGIRKGRFARAMDPLFARFNASVSFDKRLFAEDVTGSIAHVRMLGRQGIVSAQEARKIEKGLRSVLDDFEKGRFEFREELEDVHINIEEALREKIGELAGKLHTARSRNDQVALDLRLYLKGRIDMLSEDLRSLMAALVDKSEATIDLLIPGYTHLQRAQPVRLAHHLMAYFQMFKRDFGRFQDSQSRMDEMPLGAAALAGATFPIDRKRVADELGFSGISANSMDAVSDRDFALEFLFNSSVAMMHLSRLAEELILWSSAEFGFCTLPDAFCSGSSIMPQKKNPDACELIRGKTGRVYGDLIALLTTLKALPLTYNKDLQEDKEPVFDAVDTLQGSLRIMGSLIPGIEFRGDRMIEAASDPSLAATDLADKLVRDGMAFRDAHSRVGAMIRERSGPRGKKKAGTLPSPGEMVEARSHEGGTARKRVLDQIRAAGSFLQELQKAGRVKKAKRKTREGERKA
ncbi:MAG: argininosuccinate lyase [Desulfomonile tiedjei]|nr:argininosuccinate lyase [Desulfomonile tiedjei]